VQEGVVVGVAHQLHARTGSGQLVIALNINGDVMTAIASIHQGLTMEHMRMVALLEAAAKIGATAIVTGDLREVPPPDAMYTQPDIPIETLEVLGHRWGQSYFR
jgi:hypothetical protein